MVILFKTFNMNFLVVLLLIYNDIVKTISSLRKQCKMHREVSFKHEVLVFLVNLVLENVDRFCIDDVRRKIIPCVTYSV